MLYGCIPDLKEQIKRATKQHYRDLKGQEKNYYQKHYIENIPAKQSISLDVYFFSDRIIDPQVD